jgi:uncharacterized membrane protein
MKTQGSGCDHLSCKMDANERHGNRHFFHPGLKMLSGFAPSSDQTRSPQPSRRLFERSLPMNTHRQRLSSAFATVLALGLTTGAQAHADASPGKEKCYGIVKAGQNTCANLTDTHACAGQATKDKDPAEWTLVPKGACAKLGGLSAVQAKAALKLAATGTAVTKGK